MKKYMLILIGAGFILASCEKKVEPVDDFHVNVEFRNTGAHGLTGDMELNPSDSITLDFTITSPTDMSYIEIQRNGVRLDTFRLTNQTDKKSFSKVKGYRVDSAAGPYTYRVLARDSRAVFMGDGGKEFTVTVKPDFYFWSARILQVPDTVAKSNKAYFASTTGVAYSYTEGAANSAAIDFGYYYDTSSLKHSFYALSAAQPQLSYYDISTWTKNATLLKKMPTSVNFVTNLRSSGGINTFIKNNMTTGTSSKVTTVATSAGNNVIGFRTAAGKYGAISVRYVSGDSPAKETFMEIDVKVQK